MNKDKKNYKVLVVEDNPGDLLVISEFLADQIETPTIQSVLNFREAEKLLHKDECEFDVILMDLRLPDKSGQSLISEMLKVAKNCPIVILTGFTDIEFSISSIAQGITDYIVKDDLNPTILYKSITYAIERKKNFSAIKKSEKQYSDLFNLSPQPMWVYDPQNFKFVQVNEAATKHYGYTEEEFLNMTIMDIRPSFEIAKVLDVIEDANGTGILKGKFFHIKKNEEIIEVEIYSTPININEKMYKSVIAIDVTERILYEHKITKAIIKTQDDERYEIGSELHDNVCQILAASQMALGMLKDSLTSDKLLVYELCKENISLALDEIRNLSHQLAPAFFDDTTLEEAFERLLNTFNINEKYKINLKILPSIVLAPISREIKLTFYRILQEQLSNIGKHAEASTITVDVNIDKERLQMKIIDDGKGFNCHQPKGGIGFANMKRRAELFSGFMDVNSFPNHGCSVVIEIPLLYSK